MRAQEESFGFSQRERKGNGNFEFLNYFFLLNKKN